MKSKGRNSNYKYKGGAQTPPPPPGAKKGPTPEELQEKLEKNKKRFFRLAPFLLVIIVFCMIMIKRPQAPDIIFAEHSYAGFYSRISGETVVVADGRALTPRLKGGVLEEQTSLEGNVYAVLTDNAELYVFSPEGVVAEEENTADFALAAGGNVIAYYSTAAEAVISMDIASSAKTELPDSAGAEELRISPDGGAAAFVSGDKLYLWRDGATEPIGEGMFPLAASNDGERVYAVRLADDALCMFTPGGAEEELVSGVDTAVPIVISRDSSQLIVHDGVSAYLANGKYVYRIGGEGRTLPVDIFENSLREPFGFTYKGYFFDTVYATQNDEGAYYLYAVGADGTSKLFVSGSESAYQVRSNGGSAYYIRKSELNLFQNSNKGGSINKLDENASSSIVISGDKKRVFYISNTGELRALKGKGSPRLIADGVTNVKAAPGKNNAYYTTREGELYYYDGGKTVKIASDVADFIVTPHMTYYFTDSGEGLSDVYASADGLSFTLAAEGVGSKKFKGV